jgi:hypothetical protein
MSLTDFLFNGQAPKSVTTYGSTVQNLPQWFSDMQQAIAVKGNAIAAQPYEPYGAPRIAGFNTDQNQAFGLTRSGLDTEASSIRTNMNNAALAGQSANSLGDASPWLNRAGQNSYDVVGNYMNPYTDAVVDRIGDLGARNLNEKLMPAINSDFIRAGQYGSTPMMAETGRALRDVSEGVLAEQNKALQAGYGMALDTAGADMARFGQVGATAGNLSNADTSAQIDASKVAGALGTVAQDARYADINALGGVGNSINDLTQSNLDLAYKDFSDQRDYQQNQLEWMNNLVKGFQMPMSSSETSTAPLPGAQFSPSPFQSALGAGLTTYSMLK